MQFVIYSGLEHTAGISIWPMFPRMPVPGALKNIPALRAGFF
jgi:hypothetical protein